MLGIKIKGTEMPLKFNFAALYRANKLFSSEPGKDDGGSTIWLGFVTGETMVLFKAIKAMLPDKNYRMMTSSKQSMHYQTRTLSTMKSLRSFTSRLFSAER